MNWEMLVAGLPSVGVVVTLLVRYLNARKKQPEALVARFVQDSLDRITRLEEEIVKLRDDRTRLERENARLVERVLHLEAALLRLTGQAPPGAHELINAN